MNKYLSLLRGINVGGHNKVPMAELKKHYEKLGFRNLKTLLNSGNVVFEGNDENLSKVPEYLEKAFGFKIPVISIPLDKIKEIVLKDPFKKTKVTPKTRLYVTFLTEKHNNPIEIPYTSEDQSFQIINQTEIAVFSVLDLEKTGTIEAMKILEKAYGKNITTRNYNTILKIADL